MAEALGIGRGPVTGVFVLHMAEAQVPRTALDVSGLVLAGGRSSRLGQDKALLDVAGQPLLARTVHTLARITAEVLVVSNDPAVYGSLGLPARLVPDERPGEGSLMGIYSGLKAALYPQALVVACDMPFLNPSLLSYLVPLARDWDVVIPRLDGKLEPLHAVYSKACLPPMHRLLEAGGRQIVGFFDEVRVRYVCEEEVDRFDPQRLSFLNVNTQADWDRVQGLLAQYV